MAFKAELVIEGKVYNLLHCSYALKRDMDESGRPSSEVKGGTIKIEVESTDETSSWDLAIAQHKTVSGSIVFKKRDEAKTLKELRFETAYVIQTAENYDALGNQPMSQSYTLSALKLTLGSETHENEWPI